MADRNPQPSSRQSPWDNHAGRVTLDGGVAYAMTFHRGQVLNSCIQDAKELSERIVRHVKSIEALSSVVEEYEADLQDRGAAEVEASREQSLMCHDWETFWDSPVSSRRLRFVGVLTANVW